MKNNKGFTLVECMVVLAIFFLLLSWGVPAYSVWKKKHDVEADIGGLFSDLQFARMTAYSRKTITGVWWGTAATGFKSYRVRVDTNNNRSINDDGGAASQLGTKATKFTIIPSAVQDSVGFDGRGFSLSSLTFRIDTNTGAAIDCVVVSDTRIIVGRWTSGVCKPR